MVLHDPKSGNVLSGEKYGPLTTEYTPPGSLEDYERSKVSGEAAFHMIEDTRHYKPIDSYEGIHRWDPEFKWEEAEEKKLVRKVLYIDTLYYQERQHIDTEGGHRLISGSARSPA